MKIKRKWLIIGGLSVLGMGSAASLIPVLSAANRQYQITRAETALEHGDASRAEPICRDLLDYQSDAFDPDTLKKIRRIAAKAALNQGAVVRGVEYLAPLLKHGDSGAFELLNDHARQLAKAGRVLEAEQLLQHILGFQYGHLETRETLAELYRAEGRVVEAQRQYYALIRHRRCRRDWLLYVLEPALSEPSAWHESWQRMASQSPRIRFGLLAAAEHHTAAKEIADRLWEIVQADPQLADAQARLGLALARAGSVRFDEWLAQMPSTCRWHPDFWLALAVHYRDSGEAGAAVRCAWESLRRHPEQLACYRLLAELLTQLEGPNAVVYSDRYAKLSQLHETAVAVAARSDHLPTLRQLVTLSNDLGRYWEAWAWALELATADANDVTTREWVRQIEGHLADDLPIVTETMDVVARFPLDHYPLPEGWDGEPQAAAAELAQP